VETTETPEETTTPPTKKPIQKIQTTVSKPKRDEAAIMNPREQLLLEDMLDRNLLAIPEDIRAVVTEAVKDMKVEDAIVFARTQAKIEKVKATKAQKPAGIPLGNGTKPDPYVDITDWAKKNKLYT
jgi:hypothetical protein